MLRAWLERVLDVRTGELRRGVLLCACLLLVIASTVVGKIAGAALFLSRFQARQLAVVDIISVVVVALIVGGYGTIARQTAITSLVAGSMTFFSLNCVAFFALAKWFSHSDWLFPVFYGWVRIVSVLAPAQIWTVANSLFTTREAKRTFGIVGSGAILGWIIAGFISRALVKTFATESLLLAMAVLFLISSVAVLATRRYGELQKDTLPDEKPGEPVGAFASLEAILASPYLRSIAAVICISSCITTLTGWQFLAVTQQHFAGKEAMAAYFGGFNFFAGSISLFLQIVFTSRFVRRFGIGTSLQLLPVVILLGSLGMLLLGTMSAAAFLRGSDQILRYSIDRSTTELLYLPISQRIKLQVKWFIDTVIWRLGDGTAALVVLIFATMLRVSPRGLSWVALCLAVFWMFAVAVARREYILNLKASIGHHEIEAEQLSNVVLDRSTKELLATHFSNSDPQKILYALELLQADRRTSHPALRSLLNHPVAEIRRKAILILSEAGDTSVRPEVEALLHDGDLMVRTDALLYLCHNAHIDPLNLIADTAEFADFSVSSAVVAFLGRPGDSQNVEAARKILEGMLAEGDSRTRIEVARLLGGLADCFDPFLATLLADADPAVAAEAVRSIGRLRKVQLLPQVLSLLTDRKLGRHASDALQMMGDRVVSHLGGVLSDSSAAIDVRRRIPSVLVGIGSEDAQRALCETLLQSDSMLRLAIIRALNQFHNLHLGVEIDRGGVETVLAAEILGHYRSYQILHAMNIANVKEEQIPRTVSESMEQELERIFRLLALLYPSIELQAAYTGLHSASPTVSDNALEFLDNVLKAQLREVLLPLLDSKITVEEKARLGDRLVRNEIATREQAVAALLGSDDAWLRSCGAYAIGAFKLEVFEHELVRCLQDSDPLLRETARAARARLYRDEIRG